MKVVILAGGLGTRLAEETQVKPKPMVEIGSRPILWHIMNSYSHYGHHEFAVALGYLGEVIKNYFVNYHVLNTSFSVDLLSGEVSRHYRAPEDWKVHLVDTGTTTQTGGRVKRMGPLVGNETFMMTYGDGLSDVNIQDLVEFHRSHGKLATLTAVRPPARFGSMEFEGDRIKKFIEKPQAGEGWINGGFFVLEPKVMDYIDGDQTPWELDPLEKLAADGELMAYRHDGFWQCMDTLRDKRQLEALWQSGGPPWRAW